MIRVRQACMGDAGAIAGLMRSSLGEADLRVTIFGGDRVGRYLEDQLSLDAALREMQYIVADDEDGVAGYMELKEVGQQLFLNYICTCSRARGAGVARRLLSASLRDNDPQCHRHLSLDVFTDNARARDWYLRLGFESVGRTAWWSVPLPEASRACHARVAGYAQACASHARHGFSTLTVMTNQNSYLIGRLGEMWFKVADPRLLDDPDALSCLARLDGRRQVLGVFPADLDIRPPAGARRVRLAERMTTEIASLLKRLDERRSFE